MHGRVRHIIIHSHGRWRGGDGGGGGVGGVCYVKCGITWYVY